MIKLTDEDGNLFPAIRNFINILFLTIGLVFGWIAHANWVHRGEAKQIVEDMEVGTQIEQTRQEKEVDLKKRTEEANNEFKDECLDYSNTNYVDGVRDSFGDEEF